ncbi:MAG: radical SAM protein [Myxococcales bacterium]|nr:radical SAM protein [Myxococcales bacterium]
MRLRHEDFGAIVALEEPPALIHVDHALVAWLGHPPSPFADAPLGHLSAPTEVHLMVTNRCPAACPGCYTAATPDGDEPGEAELLDAVDRLAGLGVFHLALGGGESLLHPALFRVAAHARARGLVPNLTTSGLGLTPALAQACRVFGQVNVSLDGLDATYRASRGYDGAETALRALARLGEAGVPCGVNYVLSQATWEGLEATAARVAELGGNQIEILRFKPAGRGRSDYERLALSEAQARQLTPRLLALTASHPGLQVKVDCSLVPFLCAADPEPALLQALGVYGCEAGNALASVDAGGRATPCSFVDDAVGTVAELADGWRSHPTLARWRAYADTAPAPCRGCAYRAVCKGGCKVVTRHRQGDWFAPDPECPRVLAHRRGEAFVPVAIGRP